MQKTFLTGLLALSCLSVAYGQVHFIDDGKAFRYDGQCFIVNGKDTFIYSGAFQYFRCPQALWADRFRKMKAAGLNTVETEIPWSYHERSEPDSIDDYTKISLRECQQWIRMASEEFGLNVIVRPGPYIGADWEGGGFPKWLLKYKPADFKGDWLRSDDPTYLAWCQHWYRAVARALERFQITRKAPGKAGIILFQIENGLDSAAGSESAHLAQLRALAKQAYDGGIEVPYVTCKTKLPEAIVNPKVASTMDTYSIFSGSDLDGLAPYLAKLKVQQPAAPYMVMELQSGWKSDAGGTSAEKAGITAAQSTNLALYCIQNGVTAINYSDFVGGTNFGDSPPSRIATAGDSNPAIHADGSFGEKYQAAMAISELLKEYGSRFLRSSPTPIQATTGDPSVQVALRFDSSAARILFVRNTSPTAQAGVAAFSGISFHYDLGPFGSKILYVPKDVVDFDKGTWLPKPLTGVPVTSTVSQTASITASSMASSTVSPTDSINMPTITTTVRVPSAVVHFDDGGGHWDVAQIGVPINREGYTDAQYIVYKTVFDSQNLNDKAIWIKSFGDEPVVVRLNGQILSPLSDAVTKDFYNAVGILPKGNHLEILLDAAGNPSGEKSDASRGLQGVVLVSASAAAQLPPAGIKLSMNWTHTMQGIQERWFNRTSSEDDWDSIWLDGVNPIQSKAAPNAPIVGLPAQHLMTWYTMAVDLPTAIGTQSARRLLVDATGNGIIYVNGHVLGRFWQQGPQREYSVPESWLNHEDTPNYIGICLRPVNGIVALRAVEIK